MKEKFCFKLKLSQLISSPPRVTLFTDIYLSCQPFAPIIFPFLKFAVTLLSLPLRILLLLQPSFHSYIFFNFKISFHAS